MKFATVFTLLTIVAIGHVRADFIGVAWSGLVYRVNEQSGAAVQINSVTFGLNSLAGPYQGNLYTTAADALVTIDPTTGAKLGSVTMPISDFRAAAFSPDGELFLSHTIIDRGTGSFKSELMKANIQTGNLTSLGVLTLGIGAMTFSSDSTLYGWDIGASGLGDGFGLVKLATDGSGFVDVNPAIGTPRGDIQSIEFAPNGILYGARDRLFTIDLGTGAWTPVGSQTFAWDIRGIAYIPEPASVTLLVIAASAAAITRRRPL